MRSETTPGREPLYQVVWPLGRAVVSSPVKLSPPVSDLRGKTVAEVWDYGFKGDQVFAIIRERLRQRFPGVKFVDYGTFGNIHGPHEREVIANLPGLLRQHGVDAVISGIGG